MSGQSRNQRAEFRRWLIGRPGVIRAMARTLKPWHLYRVKKTGQHCTLCSFSEDATLTVDIVGHDDPMRALMESMMPLRVFGLKPSDIERVKDVRHD